MAMALAGRRPAPITESAGLRLIANKYHEGNMKRTLKRELKESAFAEQKANRIDLLGKIVAL